MLLPIIVPGAFSNIFVRLSVLVFHCYHNKLPKTWWLKITQIHYLNRVLDVRSMKLLCELKSRWEKGYASSGVSGRESVSLTFPVFRSSAIP